MTNPALKKNHWTSRVNECSVGKDARGDLNVSLRGGAENGEFAYIGQINEDLVIYRDGKLNEGELLLEVENLSISGLPLYDVQTLIKNCKSPVKLKSVRPVFCVSTGKKRFQGANYGSTRGPGKYLACLREP
ncbi:hypothetical protein ILYODFUR_016506 [Ilyodon furcidens]|uniref:PDZ domain-containing protein n=1 Tax=Ilyodon furcidens TaxID=33524 RepID=A0ABV0SY07_9TELE